MSLIPSTFYSILNSLNLTLCLYSYFDHPIGPEERALLRLRQCVLSWGYSLSLQRKHISDCLKCIPSLTQPVQFQPGQVVKNCDGAAQGTESAKEPISKTPSSDSKPDDVGVLSDRWKGLDTQE